jgi:hypothetical protein
MDYRDPVGVEYGKRLKGLNGMADRCLAVDSIAVDSIAVDSIAVDSSPSIPRCRPSLSPSRAI